jgi:hypothetical protein
MYRPVEPVTSVPLTWNGPFSWWQAVAWAPAGFRVPASGLVSAEDDPVTLAADL